MARRGWLLTVVAAVTLALVSLASNVTTMSQLTGDANTLLAVRSTISKLVNAGTVWAGLPILSGWLVRRPLQAAAAGIVSGLTALVAHYSVGQSLGMFDSEIWTANVFWFTAAVAVGGPLGLVGAAARRSDLWGLLGRLTVPAGAVVEPFVLGMFTTPAILPWPDRVSSMASGVVLLAAGVISGATALVLRRQRHPPHSGVARVGGVTDPGLVLAWFRPARSAGSTERPAGGSAGRLTDSRVDRRRGFH